MSHYPILRILHIPHEVSQFIQIEHLDTNIHHYEIYAKYLKLGVNKELKDIREFPTSFHSKSIAVPHEIDDIIISKAFEHNTSYNNILNEYLVLGIRGIDVKDKLQKDWVKSIDKYILTLKSIYDVKVLQSKLKNLMDKKSDMEEDIINISEQISTLTGIINKVKSKK